jgi:hypothetical protein
MVNLSKQLEQLEFSIENHFDYFIDQKYDQGHFNFIFIQCSIRSEYAIKFPKIVFG